MRFALLANECNYVELRRVLLNSWKFNMLIFSHYRLPQGLAEACSCALRPGTTLSTLSFRIPWNQAKKKSFYSAHRTDSTCLDWVLEEEIFLDGNNNYIELDSTNIFNLARS